MITEPAIQTRFEAKYEVDEKTGCWIWTATLDSAGYGRFSVFGTQEKAHRFAYSWFVGPLPGWEMDDPGRMELHHICGRRRCVNPAHLELMSHRGHAITEGRKKLTEDQVLEIRARSAFGDSQKELALRFGVTKQTIGKIVNRKTWKHI